MTAKTRSTANAKRPALSKSRRADSEAGKPRVSDATLVSSESALSSRLKRAEGSSKLAVPSGEVFVLNTSSMVRVVLLLLAFVLGVFASRAAAAASQVGQTALVQPALSGTASVEAQPLATSVAATEAFDPQPTATISANTEPYDQVRAEVLPDAGVTLPIRWGDWLPELVRLGVIDMNKLEDSFANQGGLTDEQKRLLTAGSDEFITIDSQNSWFTVMALWPLGLANKLQMNESSPIGGSDVANFASTAGWSLGREQNGAAYFNKYDVLSLTTEQEILLKELAENSYRPCCNNSTFFQDCNHGSALMGLLELGASQDLSRDQLARSALVANSFWFPDDYVKTAMYFKVLKGTAWKDVDAEEVLGSEYSSISGANKVAQVMASLGLLPEAASGAQCGVK